MHAFALFFTLVVVAAVLVAVAIGTYYFFRRRRDHLTPPHAPYPSPSFKGGAIWTQTQQVYRPPLSSPSHAQSPYRSPAISGYAHSQTAPGAPAHLDYGRGVYRSSVASSPARTPSQTQLSSTRTQLSSARKQLSSTRKQLSSTRKQLSSTRKQLSSTRTQLSSTLTRPSSTHAQLSSTHTESPSTLTRPPTPLTQPSWTRTQLPSTLTRPSSTHAQLSSTHTQLPRLNTVHVHEPPENEYFQTSFHVPSRVHTESEPYLLAAPAVVSSDARSDEPTSVEDLGFAEKLRKEARRRGLEMSEAQKAIAHESAKKEFNKRAAEIIFREKNKNCKEGTIDLHGLHVAEAVQLAKDQVQAARSRGDEEVRFIVGKGLHADDGKAKIRPALEDHFTERGLTHSLDSKNAGVLVVRLN
ncbi:hypothetical protein BJY52DRAFT_1404676 [Lactarius psammicola]|nr:hypothetical protein BJY52DRAFT_1404676 [Lactarius psammicola]